MTQRHAAAVSRSVEDLNTTHQADAGDPEIESRIRSYEMAYKMQFSVPELADIANEPAEVHKMYGTQPGKNSFANNCLLARRLVERGVADGSALSSRLGHARLFQQ